MTEARWKRRYRAASVSMPAWARDDPNRCVFGSNAEGRWEVYAWDVSTGEQRRLTDRPEGTMGAGLDPSGELVWWFDDAKGNERGLWKVQDWGGSGEARTAVPDLDPAYRAGLVVGSDAAIVGSTDRGYHRVHLARTGEPSVLLRESRNAIAVTSLARDESLALLSHADHDGDSRNRAVLVVDMEGREIAEIWDGPGKGLGGGSWSRVKGDNRVIVSHERTGRQRPAVWSPLTGELDDLDIDLPGEVDAGWYPNGEALLVTHLVRGRTELYRYDIATKRLEQIEIEPGLVSAARVRPDGELWYAITTAPRPAEVRRMRPGGPSEILLTAPGERAPEGVPYSDVDVGAIHALMAEPEGPRPHPTVFQVHGGPAGLDMHMFSPGVQSWVDHGFAVVMVNYRGSAGYGKEWRDAIVGRTGFMETEDIVAVRDKLVADGVVDPARVVLAGGSWGGYLTLFGVGTRPDSWSLGISGVPLADLHAHYYEQAEPLRVYAHNLFGGSPEQVPDTFTECSPITYVDQVCVPVMILAGENDPRCPIGQVNNYVKRLQELDKPHDVYLYDAGHGSLVIDEQIRQQEMRLGFAARHLGTPEPA